MLDKIFVARRTAFYADTAAILRAVLGQRRPFDIAHMRNGNHHFVVGVKIFRIELLGAQHDLRATLVAVFFLDLDHLVADDPHLQRYAFKHLFIVGDPLAKLVVLLFQLIAFETGQRPQTHVDDRSGLHFRQLEPVYQCDLGFVRALRTADDMDHLVDMIDGYQQTFQNVGPFFGLRQVVTLRRTTTSCRCSTK